MDKSKRASKTEDQTYDRKYFDHLIQDEAYVCPQITSLFTPVILATHLSLIETNDRFKRC